MLDSQYNNAVRYICKKYNVTEIRHNLAEEVIDSLDRQLILNIQTYHLAAFDKSYFNQWFVNNFKTA